MKKLLNLLLISAFLLTITAAQNLSGLKFCFDPGHGGHESDDRHMVFADFWESESNLSKAFHVKEIFENLGASIILTRTGNDDDPPTESGGTTDDPTLSQRAAIANQNNVDFFQSIHSNGWNGERNSTLMLYPGPRNDPRINGLFGYPSCPIELTCANIMVNEIYTANRTTGKQTDGDWTFYGTGRPYLGVFRTLMLPGVLSEGSFHDYPPETWRLKNCDYHRNEAYAFARTFIQLYDSTDFQYSTLAGIVRDSFDKVDYFTLSGSNDKYLPVNNITVTLNPLGKVYQGDSFNNGYFLFDSLAAGDYELIVEADGYFSDTADVTIDDKFFNFKDFKLFSKIPPIVARTVPAAGDTNVPAWDPIVVTFSRPMDTTLTIPAIYTIPEAPLELTWLSENIIVEIRSDSFQFLTDYTLMIDGTAQGVLGYQLDGNGDGVGGDLFSLSYTTGPEDMAAPALEQYSPAYNAGGVELNPVVHIQFNEMLDTTLFTNNMICIYSYPAFDTLPILVKHFYVNKKSVFNLFPLEELEPGTIYKIRIKGEFADYFGNSTIFSKTLRFTTGSNRWMIRNIDNFESGLTSNWMDAKYSGSNAGLVDTAMARDENEAVVNYLTDSQKSMRLRYGWDKTSSSWLFREYLGGGAPRNVTFNSTYLLQAYIFGDGSRTLFRFALDENYPSASAYDHEVSPWYVIDWIGWKLVSWDMANDPTGTWSDLSEGNLEGTLRFDSIQLSYDPDDPEASTDGVLYIDDLRVVAVELLGIDDESQQIAGEYTLHQNYPNPFNPTTTISFTLAKASNVRLEIFNIRGEQVRSLANEYFNAGYWTAVWDGKNDSGLSVPSGMYMYRMITGTEIQVKNMLLLK